MFDWLLMYFRVLLTIITIILLIQQQIMSIVWGYKVRETKLFRQLKKFRERSTVEVSKIEKRRWICFKYWSGIMSESFAVIQVIKTFTLAIIAFTLHTNTQISIQSSKQEKVKQNETAYKALIEFSVSVCLFKRAHAK